MHNFHLASIKKQGKEQELLYFLGKVQKDLTV